MTEQVLYNSFRSLLEEHFGMTTSAQSVTCSIVGGKIVLHGYAYSDSDVYAGWTGFPLEERNVDEMLEVLRKFHDLFHIHKGRKVYGVLASNEISDAIRDRVSKEGLYLALRHGSGSYELMVPEDFKPRAF